jgi:hypothetical protein
LAVQKWQTLSKPNLALGVSRRKLSKLFEPAKKKVHFQVSKKPWTIIFIPFLIRYFRPGCRTIRQWKWVIVLATAVDCFTLPFGLILCRVETVRSHAKKTNHDWKVNQDEHRGIFSYSELLIDAIFILDMLVMTAQAAVRDLGFHDVVVDKLVKAIPDPEGKEPTGSDDLSVAHRALTSNGSLLGPETRVQIMYQWPLRFLVMAPLWVAFASNASVWVRTATSALRLYRIWDLMRILTEWEQDLSSPMRILVLVKFFLIVVGTGHWMGCIFYFLAAAEGFSDKHFAGSWVNVWAHQSHVQFDWRTATPLYSYLVR